MEKNRCMEEFSYAYIHAVASVAGCSVDRVGVDIYSVDVKINRSGGTGRFPVQQINAQLKCTGQQKLIFDTEIKFPLPIKNYNDLRCENAIDTILIVVIVPQDIEYWLVQDESCLSLCKCGYWVSLRNSPETTNTGSITVTIPRCQPFSVQELTRLMDLVSNGEPI